MPQCVLFLPRDEGGQGLVHIQSRIDTFRLQFIQKYLAGPQDVVWRQVTSSILRGTTGLVLDMALFLMDFKLLKLYGLSPFYQSLFKTWNLFKWKRLEPANSLHWLLEEPLIKGARLDVQSSSTPGLTSMLCTTGAVTLRKVVDAAGPGLTDIQAVASLIGQRSMRQAESILNLWIKRLTDEEVKMIKDYSTGTETPDDSDPFPELGFTPNLDGLTGPFLNKTDWKQVDLHTAKGRAMYECCVLTLNRSKLDVRTDTVWRERLDAKQ